MTWGSNEQEGDCIERDEQSREREEEEDTQEELVDGMTDRILQGGPGENKLW